MGTTAIMCSYFLFDSVKVQITIILLLKRCMLNKTICKNIVLLPCPVKETHYLYFQLNIRFQNS
jgi:hypothetical protein